MDEIVPVGLHYDEGVSTYGWFFSVGIILKGLSVTGGSPLRTLAVESLGPGGMILSAMTSALDSAGNPHVIDLADTGSMIAVVDKVL